MDQLQNIQNQNQLLNKETLRRIFTTYILYLNRVSSKKDVASFINRKTTGKLTLIETIKYQSLVTYNPIIITGRFWCICVDFHYFHL